MSRTLQVVTLGALVLAAPVSAHHGFGRFDATKEVMLQGTVTGIDFVNPHAYLYFDAVGADGKVTKMRCEMRAATVLRRSGWSPEMFSAGKHVAIAGNPHRDDPASCYIETLTLGEEKLERYQQLTTATQTPANRPARVNGRPNIFGDWAQEQYLIARPPEGRGGLVPKSMVAAVESGQLAFADVPNAGWGARPVTFTPAGQAAADALRARPPDQNERARCEITSILFDWVFDGPVNRIAQAADGTITFEYGRGLERVVHMNMTSHPANVAPSRAGHSIGRWDGDTLVVDTVGFTPGTIAGTVAHSDRLHVVERFALDPQTMALKRDYTAEDPVNFTDQYAGSDIVMPADAPFAEDRCEELTYRNYSQQNQGAAPPTPR